MNRDGIDVQAIHEMGKGMGEDVGKDLEKDVGNEETRADATCRSEDYHPVPQETPLEFDPRTAPSKDWTTDGLMAFFRHPTFKRTDPAQWKPELVAILQAAISIHNRDRDTDAGC